MHLTLIGAGPGDPELISLKGWKAIQQADVILYDALVNEALLADVADSVPCIYVGKRCGQHSKSQEEINEIIVASAQQYGHVVRLKGGDPFVFGRGAEEINYAEQHGITCTLIPGISSAIAGPASARIPVTNRGQAESFWVVTATTRQHKTSTDIDLAAQSTATMVILMGTRKLSELIYRISAHRAADTPVALLQNATLPNEKIILGTLGDVVTKAQAAQFASPGIIVVGEVVTQNPRFRAQLQRQLLTAL